jgi:anti-anti-sigma factor
MAVVLERWKLDVERGPDWLIVRVTPPEDPFDQPPELAQTCWDLCQQHFTYRLVLELDGLQVLSSQLIGQLIMLQKRISQHGGTLRMCGLSQLCEESLQLCRLGTQLPNYRNREEAVMGRRPTQPR